MSLEENEIRRQLGLSTETLRRLVDNRLLRSDSRFASTYYELSLNSLIEPILTQNRMKTIIFGWFGVGFAVSILGISLLFVLLVVIYLSSEYEFAAEMSSFVGEVLAFFLMIVGVLTMAVVAAAFLRRNVRSIYRYRWVQKAWVTDPSAEPLRRSSFLSETTSHVCSMTAIVFAALRIFLGGVLLLCAGLTIYFVLVILECAYLSPGFFLEWIPRKWFNIFVVDCMSGYPDGVSVEDLVFLTRGQGTP